MRTSLAVLAVLFLVGCDTGSRNKAAFDFTPAPPPKPAPKQSTAVIAKLNQPKDAGATLETTAPENAAPAGKALENPAPPLNLDPPRDSTPAASPPTQASPFERPAVLSNEVPKANPFEGDHAGTPFQEFFVGSAERATYQKIKQALDKHVAETGKRPATHEEFMLQIIRVNGIKLPELPARVDYVYVPESGVFYVRHPIAYRPPPSLTGQGR